LTEVRKTREVGFLTEVLTDVVIHIPFRSSYLLLLHSWDYGCVPLCLAYWLILWAKIALTFGGTELASNWNPPSLPPKYVGLQVWTIMPSPISLFYLFIFFWWYWEWTQCLLGRCSTAWATTPDPNFLTHISSLNFTSMER
jgi:hypothetical protein